jgi:acetolactate synthase-1/2/3 large subunit
MALTGAQIVFESLIKEGVEVIFGFPGGTVLPFYDTLPQYPQIRHVLVRHEQGAAHAADAYARSLP